LGRNALGAFRLREGVLASAAFDDDLIWNFAMPNVVFLDGHAAWRKFNRMTIRNQLDVPSFWY
jgi:prepilin-type processing-associated H-X9-DG protein